MLAAFATRMLPAITRTDPTVVSLEAATHRASPPRRASALKAIEEVAAREGWPYAGFHRFGVGIEDWIVQHRAE
jgi:hypothetical protein